MNILSKIKFLFKAYCRFDKHLLIIEMWKIYFIGIMVGQKNEKHVWMGQNRHRHDACLLRFFSIFLFLFTNGGIANIGAHRSLGWNASSITRVVHRRFRNTFECFMLHFNWGIHVQSRNFRACHWKRRCNNLQVSLDSNSNYKQSKKCMIIRTHSWPFFKYFTST